MVILIDNGHGRETPGKRSPEGLLYEWSYTREIARRVDKILSAKGYDCRLLVPEDVDVPLGERCRRANEICAQYGAKNVVLLSIHLDAVGDGSQWMNARGWSAFVYRNCGQGSIDFANCLFDAAEKAGMKMRKEYGDKKYWARGYYILKHSNCPAVLTENLFQDNKQDVEFLLSEEGKRTITNIQVDGIENYIKNLK